MDAAPGADGATRDGGPPADAGPTDTGAHADSGPCPDADGDGHQAMSCGGDDCDDSDRLRFPGNTEVCDVAMRDEDCDPSTYGVRDADHDGAPDSACCNVDAAGTHHCGSDCDDTNAQVHPTAPEVCNMVDDDCDSSIDEMVLTTYYVDADSDGFGSAAAGAMTMTACSQPVGYVAAANDCDDSNPHAHTTSDPEVCDGYDNNCNGLIDEGVGSTYYRDSDGDTFGDPAMPMMACALPGGFSGNDLDCDDTNIAINPSATEVCNGVDDDCNGLVDDNVGPVRYRDADMDTFGDPATSIHACSLPSGYTNDATDCDDANASAHPGQTAWFTSPRANGTYDYDCSGVDDLEYRTVTYSCTTLGYGCCNLSLCSYPDSGWSDVSTPPACAVTRAWGCMYNMSALACQTATTHTQGCH